MAPLIMNDRPTEVNSSIVAPALRMGLNTTLYCAQVNAAMKMMTMTAATSSGSFTVVYKNQARNAAKAIIIPWVKFMKLSSLWIMENPTEPISRMHPVTRPKTKY